jgi:hypothetical protein
MDPSGISSVYIAGAAAIFCFAIAALMMVLTSRHIDKGDAEKPPTIIKCLLSGEALSEYGMRYRIGFFIALMFALMNTLATVFIFIASQTPH